MGGRNGSLVGARDATPVDVDPLLVSRENDAVAIEVVVLLVELPVDDGPLPVVRMTTAGIADAVLGEEDAVHDADVVVGALADGEVGRERRAVAPSVARPRTARGALVGLRIKPRPGVPLPVGRDGAVGTRRRRRVAGPVSALWPKVPKAEDVSETTIRGRNLFGHVRLGPRGYGSTVVVL